MNNYTLAPKTIKERVTMSDVIALYAPNPPPKHNRIPCPIHAGNDPNLWFSDRGYYCFVCGAGGDVIDFVQHVFGLDFPATLDKINTDFNLGIPLNRRMTLREQREAEKRHREIIAERKRKKEEKQAYEELYNSLCDEWHRLARNRELYAPKSRDEEWHPLFIEALQKIDYQKYLIDELL